jgi:hypothetical protein
MVLAIFFFVVTFCSHASPPSSIAFSNLLWAKVSTLAESSSSINGSNNLGIAGPSLAASSSRASRRSSGKEHSFRSRWAFHGQTGLAQEPGALQDVFGGGQGGFRITAAKLQLHQIPRSIGQGFQPLAGLEPQLNNDMRISLKAIGKRNRSKGFLFSNSFP